MTELAISQRFTPECAIMFLKILQRLAEVRLESEKVDIPLLKQFSAVLVEDSTSITLPAEVAEVWKGCGEGESTSSSAVKEFVRWNVLSRGGRRPAAGAISTDCRIAPARKDCTDHLSTRS